MKSTGYALFLLLSIQISPINAQIAHPEDYRVVEAALNALFSKVKFEYYYPNKPINPRSTNNPLHPDSTYTMIDPQTYEEVVYDGKTFDSLLFSRYESEIALYQLRDQQSKKVILVYTFGIDDLRREYNFYRDSVGYKEMLNAGIDVTALQPYNWDVEQIHEQDDYCFKKLTDEHSHDLKYLLGAYVQLSNVVFNASRNNALLQLGFHHKIPSGGTGGGAHIMLSQRYGKWEVVKIFGLWEE